MGNTSMMVQSAHVMRNSFGPMVGWSLPHGLGAKFAHEPHMSQGDSQGKGYGLAPVRSVVFG